MIYRIVAILMAVLQLIGPAANAHEVRPALLEVVRSADSVCRIQWKQPVAGSLSVRLRPRLADGWIDTAPARVARATGHVASYWTHTGCGIADLERQEVRVDGLDGTITDVLVRIDYGNGNILQRLLRPGEPPLSFARSGPAASPAAAYFRLGIEHIFEGVDHLAFVLGLVLIVGLRRKLVLVVTCFTIAHSLTLGLTALGVVSLSVSLVEALVALSIVFVAVEALRARAGGQTLAISHPELIALAFGLLHGFAFAGALAEIGLPQNETLLALLLFNLGVEAGQLLFIAALGALAVALRSLRARIPAPVYTVPAYAIGIVASFWFYERVFAAWG